MKIAWYGSYGGPESIEYGVRPDAVAAKGELLLRVYASSVNPIDWKMMSGHFPFNVLKAPLPYVPGFDVAGEVVTPAGEYSVGDRLYTRLPTLFGGASQQYVAVSPKDVAKIPTAMSYHEAAAVPLAGLTALQGLRDEARLPLDRAEGYRVLVIGASGGVGHYGVQIARAAGAHVTGVCSGRNAELVTSLGAHAVIDYTKTEVWDRDGRYDVILDCVGGEPGPGHTRWLTDRGVYASTMPDGGVVARQLGYSLVGRRRVRAVMLKPGAADLRWLSGLATRGGLRSHIDEVFPLDGIAAAHAKSASGRARGKIVIDLT